MLSPVQQQSTDSIQNETGRRQTVEHIVKVRTRKIPPGDRMRASIYVDLFIFTFCVRSDCGWHVEERVQRTLSICIFDLLFAMVNLHKSTSASLESSSS